MNQVVYNTSRGRLLEMTNQDLKRNVSRLAIHFDPILAIFAPFYWVYPGPEVLLIGQEIVLGLGAWAVFLIAEKILKKKLISLVFSTSYLLFFAVQRAALFDFHAVTLATTFFLFAIYFQEIKKWNWFFIFIFLTLLTKEHVGLVVLIYGIYLAVIKKERIIGLTTSVLGLMFFIVTVYFIIPYFRGGAHFAIGYFVDIKSRFWTIINNGFPYVRSLVLPNFYALFSPLTLAISLPEWAINIFSINNNQRSFFFHYNSIIVSFVFYSLVLGYKNFDRLVKNNFIKKTVFVLFIILNLSFAYKYNPVPYFVKHPVKYRDVEKTKMRSISLWQNKLKDENIKVATTPKLAPFFTNRIHYFNFLYDSSYATMGKTDEDIFKNEIDKYTLADYIIINRSEIGDIAKGGIPVKFYFKLLDDKNFQMTFTDEKDSESIEVYRKI